MESDFLLLMVNEANHVCVNEVDSEVNSELGPIEIDDHAVIRLRRGVEERLNFPLLIRCGWRYFSPPLCFYFLPFWS
jgi:hypothetical protein